MNPITEKILNSFDTKGSKRLTAFSFMSLIYILHLIIISYVIWGEDDLKIRTSFILLEYFYYGDCAMLALLLGIITSQQLIEFKNGNNEKNSNIPNTDTGNEPIV